MRIAYLCSDKHIPLFGLKGASIHVQEMVRALASVGNDVTVFVARRGAPAEPLEAHVVEVRLPAIDYGARSNDDRVERTREKELRALAMSDAVLRDVASRHRETPFDLIYERYSLFSTAGVRAAQRLGVPCVVEVNSPLLLEQQRFRSLHDVRRAEAVEQEVLRGASALLCVSEAVRDYVVARGAGANSTHVLANGVDSNRYNPKVRPAPIDGVESCGHNRFVVGFAGSLKPWHGIEVLMSGFKTLASRSRDYHLLVAGDGPLRSWIEGYADGAGIADRTTVTGWIPNPSLPSILRAMDVAVAPYPDMPDFYFSPLKLYEYMAVGRPVVASRIGQIAQVVRDRVTGLLCTPGDPASLVDCIETLRADEPLRNAMADAAVSSLKGQTWQDNARRVMAIADTLRSVTRGAA